MPVIRELDIPIPKEVDGWCIHRKIEVSFIRTSACVCWKPEIVWGWVHFEYNDGYDSNGKASNKGIVSIEYEPYESFLSQMRQLNLSVHSLIDYYDTNTVRI